ncbi:MAG: class I SAM-dependent methyltransferase [Andreesenia angusta]|nr:class I SAM-dependent methyltransferase [Andreesenia angusta]
MDPNYEFDYIAENIFYPIYPIISDDIIREIGITKGNLLDIGCGGGHLAFSLMKKTDLNAVLIDINEYAVEKAIDRAKMLCLDSRTEVKIADVSNMDLPDNYFDLIISRGSLGFWDNPEKAFTEIYRVLKPGGKTYIGGGLGNNELFEKIKIQMQEINPGWPDTIGSNNRHKKRPTNFYIDLFKRLNFYKFKFIKSKEKGRWFIIEKNSDDI